MPLDPSIPLQVQAPDFLGKAGQYVDLGARKLSLDKARATFDADVAQRQAESQVSTATVNSSISRGQSEASAAQTGADSARFHLQGEQAQMGRQIAGSFLQDPDFVNGNSDAMIQKLSEARQSMIQSGVPPALAEANTAQLISMAVNNPKGIGQALQNIVRQGNSASGQAAIAAPAVSMVPTQQGTQPFNTNANAPGGVGPVGAPLSTPNQFMQGPNGGTVVANPTAGTMQQPTAVGADAPQPIPANETPQTMAQLQGERTAAQQAILQAPQMHNINQEIARIADTDVQTGKLGAVGNKIASAFGYHTPEWLGTNADYNTLGKMLARNNAAMMAAMPGPHTNAGADRAEAANGSPEYDKVTLKKIANLNDALVTGTELYQKGLETAIARDGIFGKRKFDQAWSGAMDIDALRLKNAVDNKSTGEVNMILKNVGGAGSPDAKTLFGKLQKLDALVGQ